MDIASFAHETMEEMLNSIFLTNVMYFNNAKDVLEFIVVGPMEHNTYTHDHCFPCCSNTFRDCHCYVQSMQMN